MILHHSPSQYDRGPTRLTFKKAEKYILSQWLRPLISIQTVSISPNDYTFFLLYKILTLYLTTTIFITFGYIYLFRTAFLYWSNPQFVLKFLENLSKFFKQDHHEDRFIFYQSTVFHLVLCEFKKYRLKKCVKEFHTDWAEL